MEQTLREIETLIEKAHTQCTGEVNLINVLTAQTLLAAALEKIKTLTNQRFL